MAFSAIRRALGNLGADAAGEVPDPKKEKASGDDAQANPPSPHFAEMYRTIDAAFTAPRDEASAFMATRATRDAGWGEAVESGLAAAEAHVHEREVMSAAPYRTLVTAAGRAKKPDRAALFAAARDAMRHSHSPYSQFPVGAAILSESGAVYSGCNVENASFPEGWCAETSAIAHMVRAGDHRIVEIAVVAEKMPRITPCGGCRQRILEFGSSSTLVHLCDGEGVVESVTLADILPRVF